MTRRQAAEPIRDAYRSLAAIYEQRWRRYLDESLRATLATLRPSAGERILDVGCGTGLLARRVLEIRRDLEVFGIDLSLEMLKVAKRESEARVPFLAADATHLPFRDRTFDAVVSTSTLHHWQHPEAIFAEIHRVTRTSGRLVITDWCRDAWYFRPFALYLRLTDRTVWRIYSRAELEDLIDRSGFSVVSTSTYRVAPLWGMMTVVAQPNRRTSASSGAR